MAFSDHPNYIEIEKERKKVFKKFKDKQKERKDGSKKYLQCIKTPPTVANGTDLQVFDKTRKSGHETEDWTALDVHNEVKDGVLLQYAIDRYKGPLGTGQINKAECMYEGNLWLYQEHWGDESRSGPFDEWYIFIGD